MRFTGMNRMKEIKADRNHVLLTEGTDFKGVVQRQTEGVKQDEWPDGI